jgi:hypothetical protein
MVGRSEVAVMSQERLEICPPALHGPALGWRRRLLDWLAGSWPAAESELAEAIHSAGDDDPALEAVRAEFAHALADIGSRPAADRVWRIRCARSLRELWHLRTELFNIVSCCAGQAEATARLQPLNRHFPTRSPRSGFGSLDAEAAPRHGPCSAPR